MSAVNITFNPNPIQKRFIESRAKADLFSSRMGEGKSAALVWSVFYHTRHNRGARWALIRDTWENLQATTQKEFFKWFPPGIFGEYNATHKTFTWRVQDFEGEVQFLGMDDPADAAKLQSRELAGFGMDEPAPAAESGGINEFVFDVAMSRLRQSGMTWYSAKLAQNNSDETHWTWRRFVAEPIPGFVVWQPDTPENNANLPPGYYEELRSVWAHRPDLVRRFIDGKFGFQAVGKQVTPEWTDDMHLATGLVPVPGVPLHLLWDFGLNPTCIITQVTPMGHWLILEAYVGEDMGAYELIKDVIKPVLAKRYAKFVWSHIGDPAGANREQSSANQSAVGVLKRELGGSFRPGPVKLPARLEPLRAVLSQTRNGTGLVQVDRVKAKEVWHALRGGWHYHVARTGLVSTEPVKDIHSHPADAVGYGASILFPLGKLRGERKQKHLPHGKWFQSGGLGFEKPGTVLPKGARTAGLKKIRDKSNVASGLKTRM